MTVQFENHTVELPAIYEMEYIDNSVIEYYDQPEPVNLKYKSSEKVTSINHTPDFFVIRNDCAGWEEWKREEELLEKELKSPERYIRDEKGNWRCPPGEEYAKRFGLYYQLRSSAEIDWIYQRNIRFLEDYLLMKSLYVSIEVSNLILNIVKEHPGIKLWDLLNIEDVEADDVYILITIGEIYTDLYKFLLAEPENIYIFENKEVYRAYELTLEKQDQSFINNNMVNIAIGNELSWSGRKWMIGNIGNSLTTLIDGDDAVDLPNDTLKVLINNGKIKGAEKLIKENNNVAFDMLNRAGPKDLEIANYRYDNISHILESGAYAKSEIPKRTLRDWVKKYKEAELLYGNGYLGLLPRTQNKGNRNPRLQEATIELMQDIIENSYETIKQKSKLLVYGELLNRCENQALIPPSYKTFTKAVNNRSLYTRTKKRQGSKAAYPYEDYYLELEKTTPRHGDRPFEIGHIDHTELPIELFSLRTFKNMGRPWLTIFTDAFCREILAFYLTFDPPSYRSCMMVIRECVRQHGRLPKYIVVDGGKEFHSIYFDALLARYKCIKKKRPASKPRYGSVCERLLGTSQTHLINNLAGNTQITRDVRLITKENNPKKHSSWTLSTLYDVFYKWANEIYDTIEHPALGHTPREGFEYGIQLSGKRKYSLIPYNNEFIMNTMPSTKKGDARVKPGKGVKINYIYYWCEDFRNPLIEEEQVPVRYDPFNIGKAYAYVGGQWQECVSEYFNIFNGCSERVIKIATEELLRRNKNHTKRLNITAKKLAEFITSAEGQEKVNRQQLRDHELRQTFSVIDGGKVEESSKKTANESNENNETNKIDLSNIDLQNPDSFEEYN